MATSPLTTTERNCIIRKFGREFVEINVDTQPIPAQAFMALQWGCRAKPFVIYLPEIKDIIKVEGKVDLLDGEVQLIRQVRKDIGGPEGERILVDMLGAAKVRSYDERVERAIRISKSPTPEVVRQVGEVMTMIDNVQDSLVTLTYLSRVAGYALKKIAPRVLPKLIPYVGWISLAKDVVDLLNILTWVSPGRAAGKRAAEGMIEGDVKLRGRKILAAKKLSALLPTFREAIQIAQTTEWAFGYGISLGPILGFIQDSISGIIRQTVPGGPDVEVRGLPSPLEGPAELIGPMYAMPTIRHSPEVPVYASPASPFDLHALRILRSAPYVLQLGSELTTEERFTTLYAVGLAVETLRDSGITEGLVDRLGPGVDMPLPAPPISGTVRTILDDEGIRHNGAKSRWPLPTEPEAASPRLQAALLGPLVREGNDRGFSADKTSLLSSFGGNLMTAYTDPLLGLVEGPELDIETVTLEPAKTLFTLLHHNLVPRLDTDPASLERVYGLMTAEYYQSGKDQLTFREAEALVDLANGFKT